MCFLNEKVPCQFVCISSLSLLWYVFIYLFYISLSTSLYLSRFLSLFSLVWERERRCKFSTRNRTLSCSPFFHTLAHLRSFARSLSLALPLPLVFAFTRHSHLAFASFRPFRSLVSFFRFSLDCRSHDRIVLLYMLNSPGPARCSIVFATWFHDFHSVIL